METDWKAQTAGFQIGASALAGTVSALNLIILAVSPLATLLSFGDEGYGDELFWGAVRTLEISLFGYVLGIGLGLLGAMGKLYGPVMFRPMFSGYTTLFRAVPELILIMLLYYAGTDAINAGLAKLGIGAVEVNGMVAAICVLGVVQGAYATEVLRAGILAIPIGQLEAATALGMSPVLRFRRIMLPAMLPLALPGLANLWLNITKDSALVSVVGFTELALATQQAAGVSKRYFALYVVAQGVYLLISQCSLSIFGWLEDNVRRGQPGPAAAR